MAKLSLMAITIRNIFIALFLVSAVTTIIFAIAIVVEDAMASD